MMHFVKQDQDLDFDSSIQENSSQIGYACFICGKSIQSEFQSESETEGEEAVLAHYLLNHRSEFHFEVGFVVKPNYLNNSYPSSKQTNKGKKRSFSTFQEMSDDKILVITCQFAEQRHHMKLLQGLKQLQICKDEISEILLQMLPFSSEDLQPFADQFFQKKTSDSMSEKYLMPLNEDFHYHDPQTGILKHKDEFESDQKIEKERDLQLQIAITHNKIKAVNLDIKDLDVSKLVKNFMKIWNQIAMGMSEFGENGNEAQTDLQKADSIIEQFIIVYSLDVRNYDKEQKNICCDIFLSHILNLFNACIVRPNQVIQYMNQFRSQIE